MDTILHQSWPIYFGYPDQSCLVLDPVALFFYPGALLYGKMTPADEESIREAFLLWYGGETSQNGLRVNDTLRLCQHVHNIGTDILCNDIDIFRRTHPGHWQELNNRNPNETGPWFDIGEWWPPLTFNETKRYHGLHIADERKDDGACPRCGVVGRYINFAPVCPHHGPY